MSTSMSQCGAPTSERVCHASVFYQISIKVALFQGPEFCIVHCSNLTSCLYILSHILYTTTLYSDPSWSTV